MGRPKGGYELDGVRVPGVTTILNRFKDAGGLIHWAYEQGKAGVDYRVSRDAAADAGTCAHAMIEADWHHQDFDRSAYKPETLAKADHAFLAYLEWKEQTKLEIVAPELSLVSRQYRFGGTMDAIMVNTRLMIGDYKTANAIYPDMLIQIAGGYALLWCEHHPDQALDGITILRFSKPAQPDDPISFHQHFYSAELFPLAKRQFILLREAYDLDKRLAKLI